MSVTIMTSADRYYQDFATHGDFTSVPMASDLRFSGPMQNYADGPRYRLACAELASNARSCTIRHQFVEGDQVHTVYDLDFGLPSGPIATSETLTFVDGVMVAVDLIIDSSPLRPKVTNS